MSAVLVPTELVDAPALPAAKSQTTLVEVLQGIGGMGVLGLCAVVGSGDPSLFLSGGSTGISVGLGALVLTGPALLVVHQFLRLEASPESLVDALANAWVRAGRLALGLAPTMLFFSAFSGLWLVLFSLFLGALGAMGMQLAFAGLMRAEGGQNLTNAWKMAMLTSGWAVLTLLIALRLAFSAIVGLLA